MNIVSLETSNVKRLKAVQITPDGRGLVIVGGNNGQGKSSVLDSILYALGGASTHCQQPVRFGEDKARIVCTLDSGLVIQRTFTATGGTALTVTNGDGEKFTSPQKMLDAMVGRLSFDPLEFSRMDAKSQLATLKALVGLDFAALDAQRKALYDERTLINRDAKAAWAGVEGTPFYEGVPEVETSASELMTELKRRQEVNAGIDVRFKNYGELTAQIKRGVDHIAGLEAQIAQLQKQLDESRTYKASLERQATTEHAALQSIVKEDEASILAQLDDIQALNGKVAANAQRRELSAKAQAMQAKAAKLTAQIENIDAQKNAQLTAAKFPVPGMSFNEDGVLLNGIPFAQASDAEKIRVSVSMGLAMNPQLKVVLIRDGSLLDHNSLAVIASMAAENGAQVWIERVGEGDECSVIIEDGQIKEA
ncbi:MAG: AAA family ATPase [Acidobacteriota bacterium]